MRTKLARGTAQLRKPGCCVNKRTPHGAGLASNCCSATCATLAHALRTPGFAAIAILVMALGIGANTAMFTIVRSVLLKPLPFPEPERLVALYEQSPDGQYPYNIVAGGMFAEWKKAESQLLRHRHLGEAEYNLSGARATFRKRYVNCLHLNLLPRSACNPRWGATSPRPTIAVGEPTVLMSWGLWKRRFGGDPSILNRPLSGWAALHRDGHYARLVCLSRCHHPAMDAGIPGQAC